MFEILGGLILILILKLIGFVRGIIGYVVKMLSDIFRMTKGLLDSIVKGLIHLFPEDVPTLILYIFIGLTIYFFYQIITLTP